MIIIFILCIILPFFFWIDYTKTIKSKFSPAAAVTLKEGGQYTKYKSNSSNLIKLKFGSNSSNHLKAFGNGLKRVKTFNIKKIKTIVDEQDEEYEEDSSSKRKNQKKNNDKSEEEENEEDENPIITNNDEFGTVNDLPSKPNNKSICNINKHEHHRAKSKKLNDGFKINTPIAKFGTPHMNLYSLLLQGDDNISLENKNKIKKCKIKQKKKNNKIKKYIKVYKKNEK